jgi:hypothetical protein
MQATGKAEKQVDKASDKVGSAAKEVSHETWLLVPVYIFSKSTQPYSCDAQALLRPVHNFKISLVNSVNSYSWSATAWLPSVRAFLSGRGLHAGDRKGRKAGRQGLRQSGLRG